MTYTHVPNRGPHGVRSPVDGLCRAVEGKSEGIVYEQKRRIPHLMRIDLTIVGRLSHCTWRIQWQT